MKLMQLFWEKSLRFYQSKIYSKIRQVRGGFFILQKLKNQAFNYRINGNKISLPSGVIKSEDPREFVFTFHDEYKLYNELIDNFGENKSFLDIGSYRGFYSVIAAKHFGSKVICVEADRSNFAKTKKNTELNNTELDLHNKAAWDTNTQIKTENRADGKNKTGKGEKEVEAVKLSEYLEDEIDIVKIDIEGAEFKALKGLEKIILSDKPEIFLELHKKDRLEGFDHKPEEVIDFIENLDYKNERIQKGEFDDIYHFSPS
jgi:FkbM family methyltransferase